MGSIVGILLIVGGISLYRSFAMYKEEKTFDVLNGTVPDFVYKESILNGAYPVLKSSTGAKLVPVTIDENDGTVRKADIKDEWYKYAEKRWANAVILVDGVTEPKNDEVIPEEEIESYFVWIPKYQYKIFDMGKYDSVQVEGTKLEDKGSTTVIDIEFGLTDTIDDETKKECKTSNASGEDGKCHEGYWMTHPAFTAFENSKGFWVGKFETGYNQDTTNSNTINVTERWTTKGAEQNIESSSKVIIKPNVYSWRNITVKNAFDTSYSYQRELDSHMMKNTEWGAVAYLSHSKYGTCDGNSCTEVRINNDRSYVTGHVAQQEPTIGYNAYSDRESTIYPNSKLATTTLNNTGIFDMSGGSWEQVMGYTYLDVGGSGLTEEKDLTEENAKYFDKYNTINNSDYHKRILGDATGEMGPFAIKRYGTAFNTIGSWVEDTAQFIKKDNGEWFLRGGNSSNGTQAGLFSFRPHNGALYQWNDITFRIVLTPIDK